jgi:facilitated trehalose transporter
MNRSSRPQDGVELELDELSSRSSRTSLSRFEEENFKNLLPQILATTISAAYQIGLGMSLAFSAIFIPQIQESRDDITLTKTELSWFASVLVLATPIGALLSAVLMEKWGRINALKISALPGVVGWVLLATAVNFPMLLVGRILLGIASGKSEILDCQLF